MSTLRPALHRYAALSGAVALILGALIWSIHCRVRIRTLNERMRATQKRLVQLTPMQAEWNHMQATREHLRREPPARDSFPAPFLGATTPQPDQATAEEQRLDDGWRRIRHTLQWDRTGFAILAPILEALGDGRPSWRIAEMGLDAESDNGAGRLRLVVETLVPPPQGAY